MMKIMALQPHQRFHFSAAPWWVSGPLRPPDDDSCPQYDFVCTADIFSTGSTDLHQHHAEQWDHVHKLVNAQRCPPPPHTHTFQDPSANAKGPGMGCDASVYSVTHLPQSTNTTYGHWKGTGTGPGWWTHCLWWMSWSSQDSSLLWRAAS